MRQSLALLAVVAAVLPAASAFAEIGESRFPELPSAEMILMEARGAAKAMVAPRARPLALPRAASGRSAASRIDGARLLRHLEVLSSDEMTGRRAAGDGSAKARKYIIGEFVALGIKPLGSSFEQPFGILGIIPEHPKFEYPAVNIVGHIRGSVNPDRYLVISAHYDHVGQQQPEPGSTDGINNGADDNASGTAGVMALAAYLRANPPAHSVVFLLSDAEELGQFGAKYFISRPPVPASAIFLNLNLDMIGRDDSGGLFLIGKLAQPLLGPWVDLVAPRARVSLLPVDQKMDVEFLSRTDSGPFLENGIPTLTFFDGIHEDYHKVTDEFSRIDRPFYIDAVETILDYALEADRNPPTGRAVAAR